MNMDDLYRLLRTGHIQAQGIVDTVTDPLLVLDEGLKVISASRAFYEAFQVDRFETMGQPLFELGNGQWDIPDLRRLLLEVIPKATAIINYEVDHEFPHLGRRTMLITARPLRVPDNNSRLMLVAIVDASDAVRRDAAKDMLFSELRHRMKNLLSVTQSIARQTMTAGRTAEQYRDDFLGRFSALVEAEDVSFGDDQGGGLSSLADRVLTPYRSNPDAVAIEGPPMTLPFAKMQTLSLILHELATNAAKYGALSRIGGRVELRWALVDDNSRLHVTWVERGGPLVSPPTGKGFGSKLLHSAATYSLQGKLEQHFAPEGLTTEIIFPVV